MKRFCVCLCVMAAEAALNGGGDLSQGGDNIPSPDEGTYEVTLDLSKLPYSCTLVKQ